MAEKDYRSTDIELIRAVTRELRFQDDATIGALWGNFSESACAGWLDPTPEWIKLFHGYLADLEGS